MRRALHRTVWVVLTTGVLAVVPALHAGMLASDASRHAIDVRHASWARDCSGPRARSLVTGKDLAAHLRTCALDREHRSTFLFTARLTARGRDERAYALSSAAPKLLSVRDGRVVWLENAPEPVSAKGNAVRMVEMDLSDASMRAVGALALPFEGSLHDITRGKDCWIARFSEGPPSTGMSAFVIATGSGLRGVRASPGEGVLFWDNVGGAFVLAHGVGSAGRAIDCEGNVAQVSPAAAELVAMRSHMLDRFHSLASAGPVYESFVARRARLFEPEPTEDGVRYRTRATFDDPDAFAATDAGDCVAVVAAGGLRVLGACAGRSPPRGTANGTMQIGFLKERPVLVLLDGTGIDTFDLER